MVWILTGLRGRKGPRKSCLCEAGQPVGIQPGCLLNYLMHQSHLREWWTPYSELNNGPPVSATLTMLMFFRPPVKNVLSGFLKYQPSSIMLVCNSTLRSVARGADSLCILEHLVDPAGVHPGSDKIRVASQGWKLLKIWGASLVFVHVFADLSTT